MNRKQRIIVGSAALIVIALVIIFWAMSSPTGDVPPDATETPASEATPTIEVTPEVQATPTATPTAAPPTAKLTETSTPSPTVLVNPASDADLPTPKTPSTNPNLLP